MNHSIRMEDYQIINFLSVPIVVTRYQKMVHETAVTHHALIIYNSCTTKSTFSLGFSLWTFQRVQTLIGQSVS